MLKLFNTLSRKVEEFKPLNPSRVGMYTCGPTVYDYMHIGNLRTFILADTLVRTLKANGYEVKHVQNITDIDDKIIARAKERNITIRQLTDEFTKYFLEDIQKLNILSASVQPKATEHIEKMIKFIEELIKKGLAYVEKDGSVYFDISKFPGYGKLSRLQGETLRSGTRILSDNYEKDNVQDFALWKATGPDEIGWDSPWGKGRPGWHIECSVMSEEYLCGEQSRTIDIHAGGVDLQFPHHENEIAQSEGKSGKQFVKYFIHGEHLLVNEQKMSKSLNNFFTLKDLEDKGFDPLAFRYLVLTAHYRDKLNFTWESLQAAQNAYDKLVSQVAGLLAQAGFRLQVTRKVLSNEKFSAKGGSASGGQLIETYRDQFFNQLNDDLGTPGALAVMWKMLKSNIPAQDKYEMLLSFDEILGLDLERKVKSEKLKVNKIPSQLSQLVQEREKLRKEGKWEEADRVRRKIEEMGYIIEDSEEGTIIRSVKREVLTA